MKILLTTLNAKFTHSSLAIRYLKKFVEKYSKRGITVDIKEFTINQHKDYILKKIYLEEYDLVVFSTYIWNIDMSLEIAKNLKKVSKSKILFGGPEVSYDFEKFLYKYKFIDYIIYGEGEVTLNEFIDKFEDIKKGLEIKIDGLVYFLDDKLIVSSKREKIENLDIIPFPYDNLDELENRIIYYESSRGCPFSCSYCLSSIERGVRFFSFERVKRDLKFFLDNKVMQVKFVDRTFNAKLNHSKNIFKFLIENDNGITNFHFEMTASLVDDEMIEILKNAREGLFQFEIGVQSTSSETIKEINRKIPFSKVEYVTKELSKNKNIHLHLDLIAGLPFETFDIFMNSLDEVLKLRPEKLQLGFLKLLKGSSIRKNKEKYGYVFDEKAPYEVLENKYISYKEMIRIKEIEELLESYYNSGYFKVTMEYILKHIYNSPSKFFISLSKYWEDKNLDEISHKSEKLFVILYEFIKETNYEHYEIVGELLQFDFYRIGKKKEFYWFLNNFNDIKSEVHEFFHDEDNIEKYIPKYKNLKVKDIIKKVLVREFNFDIMKLIDSEYEALYKLRNLILFDYDISSRIFDFSKYYKIK